MTYAHIHEGAVAAYPVYQDDIFKLFPNTSFPEPFLPPDGYVVVEPQPQPPCGHEQEIREGTPALKDGVWQQTWVIEAATPEAITQRTQDRAESVRSHRDQLLAATDWTQLADAKEATRAAFAGYRQALRDVPAQKGFPWSIAWPDTPAVR